MHRDAPFTPAPAWLGAGMLATVSSLDDPDQRNRVQVRLCAFDGATQQDAPMWARVVSNFAGDNRGTFFLPDVGDEVLVVFAGGDARVPLVVGGLWNGAAKAPADTQSGGVNRYKVIRSKNGIVITLDDQSGQETLKLETPAGQKLTLSDGPSTVKVEDANGNSITLDSSGVTVQASAKVTVSASSVSVSAGTVTVDSAMSSFSGVVKCDTLIASAVISSSYTPGAGNVW
jgi:uncharacterized protein involved in type VI secretion and phage assembly